MVPIPAGTFEMGRHVGYGDPWELPVHTVHLDAFFMDVYEVTNAKYAACLNTAYWQGRVTVSSGVVYQVGGAAQALCDTTTSSIYSRITWNGSIFGVTAGKEDHPMVMVSWYGCCAYANQRSREDGLTPCYDENTWTCNFDASGYRLPTEAEWEYAARGGQHDPYTMYPWGNTIDGSMANYRNSGDPFEAVPIWFSTTPVGYYDGGQIPPGVDMANGYGLYDTAGNVWEWCWDWFGVYSSSPANNPTGPDTGSGRVDRGGGA
jgi:formylglycine-generating enzyme required for sulfatase activity